MPRSRTAHLADFVTLDVDFQRSVSIDKPGSVARVTSGYIPTERALDMLARVTRAAESGPRVRAWSVTGPYGSGKSSFIALASVLLGCSRDESFRNTVDRLNGTAPHLFGEIQAARTDAGVGDKGYILALTAAGNEPISRAVVRALGNGAEQFWAGRGRKPRVLAELRRLAEMPSPPAEAIVQLFAELETSAPVFLAIDEFGKTLEFAAGRPAEGDLYVLQLLAERVNASVDHASCILTLQHLAISDYAQSVDSMQRREWTKIQGRFQEVAFANSPDQAAAFIQGHLSRRKEDADQESRIAEWAGTARALAEPIESFLLRSAALSSGSVYPLHPLVVALAPGISQRFSQSDRSLHAWLAGDEPGTLSRFLRETELTTADQLPVYGPDMLFDYFLGSPESQSQRLTHDGRLTEVLERVRETRTLPELQRFLMKTVGLLNLTGQTASLKASAQVLSFAAIVQGFRSTETLEALKELEDAGFLLYREHADEFRVWQGSDVDIEAVIASARERVGGIDLFDELNRISPAEARVAQRHGHKTGTFRYFRTVYSDLSRLSGHAESLAEEADGLLLLSFDNRPTAIPSRTELSDGRPVVVCLSPDGDTVSRLLVDSVALSEAATDELVKADPVARKEIRERVAQAGEELAGAVQRAFDPARTDLRWFALNKAVEIRELRALSGLLSDVCDEVYSRTIPLHNEILNRVQLTSQGAKARRELLAHMLEAADEDAMGISGFGPERSMYASFFGALGLHVQGAGGAWTLRGPAPGSCLVAVWDEIEAFVRSTINVRRSLDELYSLLTLPPFGIREPVLPVLVLAYLAIHADDVAVYQDGNFEPELTIPLMERLIKAPDRFAVRRIGGGGLRELAAKRLTERFGVSRPAPTGMRNATLITAVRPIFGVVRKLNEYGQYTSRLSDPARRARAAITSANELDELLFTELPKALKLDPIGAEQPEDERIAARFVDGVSHVLEELSVAYDTLLFDLDERVSSLFNVRPGAEVRPNLRERARRLQGQVIDRRLNSFVAYALDERLSDRAWLEAVCMSLAEKSPSTWRDADLEVFDVRLRELAGLFARVEHLCSAVDSDSSSQGFIARRVAVTHPNGSEASKVVWADENDLPRLRQELQKLKERLGDVDSGARIEAFLAVLADDVLSLERSPEMNTETKTSEGANSASRKRG